MKSKQVIAYYRKSTNPRGKSDEEGVAYQQSRIREYAKDNELTIIKEFFDVGVTGNH
ncbi:recombinase family protein [Peribacillus sp. NPDC097198]|uniref:recombinase family protein n=1 Tax=Peribacillus sp. NPDC097198 TaxID=3364397 RepID=UPI003825BBD3